MNYDEFEEVKRFVASMAKVFQISEYGSRCAVIVYGNQANLFVKLDASKNSRDFITSVDKLSRIGGRRRSFRGLELALDVLSNFNGGARRKVPKAVVVFTSGPESSGNDNAALMRVSKELRDQNILVFVVGIGPSLNTRVLTSLFQSSANLFPVTSFTELRDQSGPLTKQVCGKVGKTFSV